MSPRTTKRLGLKLQGRRAKTIAKAHSRIGAKNFWQKPKILNFI